MVNKCRDVRDSKNMEEVTKSQRILQCESSLSIACKARHQFWLFVSYVQPLWLYTGIHRMYTRTNNRLNPFITALEMDFLIIWLIILMSIVVLVFSVLLLEK